MKKLILTIVVSLFMSQISAQNKSITLQSIEPSIKDSIHKHTGLQNLKKYVKKINTNTRESLYSVNLKNKRKNNLSTLIVCKHGCLKKKIYEFNKIKEIKDDQLLNILQVNNITKIDKVLIVENHNQLKRYVVISKKRTYEFDHNYKPSEQLTYL